MHDRKRLLYVLVGGKAVVLRRQCRDHFAVLADDERGALDEVMVDIHAAHVLLPGLQGGLGQIEEEEMSPFASEATGNFPAQYSGSAEN